MPWNRKKSWNVDHTYDEMLPIPTFGEAKDKLDEIICAYPGDLLSSNESASDKRVRRRSLWVVYVTMCFISIGFSIVISGIFPYLKLLEKDDQLSKTYLGWVVAANPLGLIFSAPAIGYISNRLGSIRGLAYMATVMFAVANVIYALLPAFAGLWYRSAFHVMMFSRILVGISSGLITMCRSYLASATTVKERTGAFSTMSAFQSLGFIIGPVIQMLTSLIIADDMMKYQATGFISALIGVINFFMMTPYVFTECDMAAKERDAMEKLSNNNADKPSVMKPDVPALLGVMGAFFLASLIYILLETLLEPLIEDQYAWCENLAVVTVGVILSGTGAIFLVMFMVSARLAQIFDERKLLLIGGVVVTVIGLLLLLPWSSTSLKYCSKTDTAVYALAYGNQSAYDDLATILPQPGYRLQNNSFEAKLFENFCAHERGCLGCPPAQTWCLTEPQLPFVQLIVGFTCVLTVFPISLSMSSTLFSKMLGPMPQGTWMGIFSAIGSAARMLGPIYVSYVYSNFGTRYTFGILALFMIAGGLQILYFYNRLVPMNTGSKPTDKTQFK